MHYGLWAECIQFWRLKAGVGNLRLAGHGPRAILVRPARPPEEKEIIWMNIVRTMAIVMSAARDKNPNFFPASGGKKGYPPLP